jgi:hypothetical protein
LVRFLEKKFEVQIIIIFLTKRSKTLFDEVGLAHMTNLMLYVGKLNASKMGKKIEVHSRSIFSFFKTFVKKIKINAIK